MKNHNTSSPARTLGVVAIAAAALLVAGCAPTPADTVSVGKSKVSLPQEIAEAGVLKIGTDPIIGLPWTALDKASNDNAGLDPDLGRAIGKALNLKVKFVSVGFDSLIPSLQAQRIDLVMSDMLDTTERQQAIDFVDYVNGGDGMLVKASSKLNPRLIDELCGQSAGALRGAASQIALQGVKCTAGNPIDIQLYTDTNGELAALDSGRIDVAMGDPSIWGYLASQQPTEYRSVGDVFDSGLIGAGVLQGSKLGPAVQAALNTLIDNGEYAKILAKYGMPKTTYLSKATVNGTH